MCNIDKNLFLNNLKVFIEEQKTWLQNTLDSVGWDISKLETSLQSDEPHFVTCSINPEHRIPQEHLLNHENKCERINGDYPKITDLPNLDVTADVKGSIRFVPDGDDGSSDNLDSNATIQNKNQEKSTSSTCLVELLAAERDAKRRRAAHRGKRVHSNKKSYVEVLREVISSQMETLDDDSNIDIKPETIEADPSQKTIILPRTESYLGVGSKCFNGNPFKRWINIEDEERELIKEMKTTKNDKHSEYDRRREDTRKKYTKYEKSNYYDDDDRGRRYQEHRDYKDRHRDTSESVSYRNYYSYSKSDDKSRSTVYDEDKYSKRSTARDDSERKRREGSFSESYETGGDKRKKKSKKRSRERRDDSDDSGGRHKKKSKKKSHEKSAHKKKHRKSKHSDAEAELS